jgi:hypothetical protein
MIGVKAGPRVDKRARRSTEATVEWNQSAGLAARRMRLERLESLEVVADGRSIGRISRRDIERCEAHGNWLEAVMVADLIPEPTDTCN